VPLADLPVTPVGELCTSCARCCNGRIFGATTLKADERQRFGVHELPQPCPHLGPDKRCGIYSTRPAACVAYLCEPAAQLERGELTIDEARRRVQTLSPG